MGTDGEWLAGTCPAAECEESDRLKRLEREPEQDGAGQAEVLELPPDLAGTLDLIAHGKVLAPKVSQQPPTPGKHRRATAGRVTPDRPSQLDYGRATNCARKFRALSVSVRYATLVA